LNTLSILVLADLHYLCHAGDGCAEPGRLGQYGLEWTQRAIAEAWRVASPDVIVLLGDIVNDGAAAGAEQDLAVLAAAARAPGVPVIVVPGNHDGDVNKLLRGFGDRLGAHRLHGYVLYSFADEYEPDLTTTRPPDDIAEFLKNHSPSDPLIALQHNPLYLDIPNPEWPFVPTNAADIIACYERVGAVLSLSGHYHQGRPPFTRNGITYLTAGALAEAPFSFYIITIRGREVSVEHRHLQLPDNSGIFDMHVHTPFGYCAEDVQPDPCRERAELLGLAGITFVEHAGQLYLCPEAWENNAHLNDPGAIRKARQAGTDRMDAYRSTMARFRSDFVRVGLEVDCDRDGGLTLLEEDRDGWDILLGAVHHLPSHLPARTLAQERSSFLHVVEWLLPQGLDVLAHPFRYFHRKGLPRPVELYRPMAKLLAAHGVAAEINFHTNEPDPQFFAICAEEGVEIATGSDAHALKEVGDMYPHLRLLEEIGLYEGTELKSSTLKT